MSLQSSIFPSRHPTRISGEVSRSIRFVEKGSMDAWRVQESRDDQSTYPPPTASIIEAMEHIFQS